MFIVVDASTLNHKFDSLEEASQYAERRGNAVVVAKVVGELDKPAPEENVWTEADKLAYERESRKAAEAWARSNNED